MSANVIEGSIIAIEQQLEQLKRQLTVDPNKPNCDTADPVWLTAPKISQGGEFGREDLILGSKVADRNRASFLPEPELLRAIIKTRDDRSRFFAPSLFADPAWDMILDLLLAKTMRKRVSVTSLCIASRVPTTTALRWINRMVEDEILIREEDRQDRRRTFLSLSENTAKCAVEFFNQRRSRSMMLGC